MLIGCSDETGLTELADAPPFSKAISACSSDIFSIMNFISAIMTEFTVVGLNGGELVLDIDTWAKESK